MKNFLLLSFGLLMLTFSACNSDSTNQSDKGGSFQDSIAYGMVVLFPEKAQWAEH